jgi:hypothetical protein
MLLRFFVFWIWVLPLQAQNGLQFTNTSRITIYQLVLKASGATRWSEDMLARPLGAQTTVNIALPNRQECRYEISGKDENGRTLFNSMRIDVCENDVAYTGSYFLSVQPKSRANNPMIEDRFRQNFPEAIDFINQSASENIHALYLKPVGAKQWSDNILQGVTIFLSTGEAERIAFEDLNVQTCTVDVRAEGLGRKPLGIIRNIDICAESSVLLRFQSRANPTQQRNQPQRVSIRKLQIKNVSRSENIHQLYLKPSTQRTWGENRLDGLTIFLAMNESVEVRLPELADTCIFDIRANGLGGKDLGTLRNIDLCRSNSLEVDFD